MDKLLLREAIRSMLYMMIRSPCSITGRSLIAISRQLVRRLGVWNAIGLIREIGQAKEVHWKISTETQSIA